MTKRLVSRFERETWVRFGIGISLFLIMVLRSYQAVLWPVAAYEDGRDILGFFVNNPNPSSILRSYNGYVSLGPNALGWLITRAPLQHVPHLLVFCSLIFACMPLWMIMNKRFSWLIPDARDRRLICLVLCVLPLGKGFMINNLTYSQWNLLAFLLMSLANPFPEGRWRFGLCLVLLVGCVFSHPLSILVIPLCVFLFFLRKGVLQRAGLSVVMVSAIIYQLTAVNAGVHLRPGLDALLLTWKVFLARVCFETVFGTHATHGLLMEQGLGVYLVYAVGMLILCLPFVLSWNEKEKKVVWAMIGALGLGLGIVAISCLTRYPNQPDIFLIEANLQRYFYVPRLYLAILIMACLLSRVRTTFSRAGKAMRCIVPGLGIAYLVMVNAFNGHRYGSSQEEGMRLRNFIRQVQDQRERARSGQPHQPEVVLERPGPWDIVIRVERRIDGETSAASDT